MNPNADGMRKVDIQPINLRCKSSNTYTQPKRPKSTYTHKCFLAEEHKDGHQCICGHTWASKEKK